MERHVRRVVMVWRVAGARPQELLGSISGLTVKGSTTLFFLMRYSCQESFHRNRNNNKIQCIRATSVD